MLHARTVVFKAFLRQAKREILVPEKLDSLLSGRRVRLPHHCLSDDVLRNEAHFHPVSVSLGYLSPTQGLNSLVPPSYFMALNLHVVLEEQEEGGFVAYVPELPGCHTQGENREEALENIRQARDLYLEVLKEKHAAVSRKVEVFPLKG